MNRYSFAPLIMAAAATTGASAAAGASTAIHASATAGASTAIHASPTTGALAATNASAEAGPSAAAATGASDLSLGPASIQKIIAEQLFNQNGRWYLVDNGPCYAFFDRPKTHLTDGRLVLNARLSARIGIQMGESCAGTDLVSNVTMSARPVGKASSLTLQDIRFDKVDDSTSRDALNVIQQIAPNALPEAFSFDLLGLVKDKPISAVGVPVTVSQFRILDTETRRDAVRIVYEMSLTAP